MTGGRCIAGSHTLMYVTTQQQVWGELMFCRGLYGGPGPVI